jgi:hypothetical protein
MNKTLDTIQKNKEEFENLPIQHSEACAESPLKECNQDCPYFMAKSFLLSSQLSLLQAVVEEIESLQQSLPKGKCRNAESEIFGRCFDCEKTKGYNLALSDLSSHLQEVITSLSKK